MAHSPLAAPYGVTAGPLHLQPCSGNHPVPDTGAGPGVRWGTPSRGAGPERVPRVSWGPSMKEEKLRLGLGIFFQKADKNNSLKE